MRRPVMRSPIGVGFALTLPARRNSRTSCGGTSRTGPAPMACSSSTRATSWCGAFMRIDKMSTALGTDDARPRSYRYGYGILDENLNGVADPGEKRVYFEISDYAPTTSSSRALADLDYSPQFSRSFGNCGITLPAPDCAGGHSDATTLSYQARRLPSAALVPEARSVDQSSLRKLTSSGLSLVKPRSTVRRCMA